MNKLYFVTGNNDKFREAQSIIAQLQRVDLDLPEEQALDPQVVISKKLDVARTMQDGSLLVEDTSLYLDGLNGFPGPLIKWLLHAVGNQGIYDLAQKIGDKRATAKTVIGYFDGVDTHFFEGAIDGKIVKPYGNEGFGWDAIFQPNVLNETFAEMGNQFKPEFSMRTEAFTKLKEYLDQ